MASNGNFTTWSPLFKNTTSNYNNLSNGNTRFDGNTNNSCVLTDFAIPIGTKFYAEVLGKFSTNYYAYFGIAPPTLTLDVFPRNQANVYALEFRTQSGSLWTVNSVSNTTVGSDSSDVGQTSERVIGIAVNRVDNELKLYLDNTLKFTLSIPSTGEYHFMAGHTGGTGITSVHYNFNGGQDSTGGGDFSAGSAKDENGFGEFQYAPPSGHLAPSSANLPISDAIDPAQTDDSYPNKNFNAVTWTGDGTNSRSISVGFQPDLIWFKSRSSAFSNRLYDTSRGINSNGGKRLFSNTTGAETDQTSGQDISAVGTDGFTTGASSNLYTNDTNSGGLQVAWCWRANGGTTASNSEGDITSTVQANTKAGFSIVTYTGNRTGTGVSTVGHGLSSAPDMVITKSRSDSGNWWVQHTGTSSASKMLNLQADSAETDKSGNGTLSRPTATVFGTNYTDGLGTNGQTHIAYCWHNVEGYQKFGSYVGNNNADGPFIYTGFRPRMFFVKLRNSAGDWWIQDTGRSTFNVANKYIAWNRSDAEATGIEVDFLSNGFKIRTTSGDFNSSGATILYGAWGDVPFKYNNTF